MAQEDVGLALGLSLGSGGGQHELRNQGPSSSQAACALLEPSLTLSLPADSCPTAPVVVRTPLVAAVKRELRAEEEYEAGERALYSVASSAAVDDDEGCNSRKKLRLTKDQSALLEDRFKEHSTLNPKQKVALAKQLNLRPRQVEVWFQNRRARSYSPPNLNPLHFVCWFLFFSHQRCILFSKNFVEQIIYISICFVLICRKNNVQNKFPH
ncbi:hypothetical protein ABZP36_010561 [Zizania latifolia]